MYVHKLNCKRESENVAEAETGIKRKADWEKRKEISIKAM